MRGRLSSGIERYQSSVLLEDDAAEGMLPVADDLSEMILRASPDHGLVPRMVLSPDGWKIVHGSRTVHAMSAAGRETDCGERTLNLPEGRHGQVSAGAAARIARDGFLRPRIGLQSVQEQHDQTFGESR